MCVNLADEKNEFEVTVTDCRDAHDSEVMLRTKLSGDRTWPGDVAVEAAAEPVCLKAFESYVGIAYDESRLDWDLITTVKEDWEAGDRTIICMVFDPDAETSTEAFKGSGL
ncbi:septum formation domain protein [Knoellia sinensis KCTC 19936]|uniref:Septum formation domain protein n=2 Tax=Knoellia TaxID=136099 RepID=A0A0A0JC37_9MICO|nr:septum formation domain protein [Knoellia sinensis KCTC 19936]